MGGKGGTGGNERITGMTMRIEPVPERAVSE